MNKRSLLTSLCLFSGLFFVVAKEPVRIVAPAPPQPADSVLSVETSCVASVVTDSVFRQTVRTARTAPELEGVDSIGIYTTTWSVSRDETFQTVQQRLTYVAHEVDEPAMPDSIRTGHYIQAALGLGYGALRTPMVSSEASDFGHLAGLFQLQYAYFFHPEWGVSVGLGMSTYGGGIRWQGSRTWTDQTDTDGERYDHTATAARWRERQRTWLFDIPLALQYQHLFSPAIGLYAAAGLNIGFPVASRYWLTDGELTHTGYYDPWHLTITDWSDFYTERVGEDFSTERKPMRLQPVQAAVRADLGILFPVASQWDLLLGAYFRYTLNNMQVSEPVDVAWAHTSYEGEEAYRNHSFMGHEYASLVESTEARSVHPWQVGLKLGVQWHYVDHRIHAHVEYDPLVVYDTTTQLIPRTYMVETLEYDTVMTPYEEIRQLMKKAIIWFDLNSYEPKLDPVDILDQMAAVLIANPTLRCEVNGHTCTIGRRAYNQKLSEKRARAVADRLVALGVKPEQLECHGFCSDVPYFSESHQLFLDRRCEIIPIEETNEQHIIHQVIKGKK